jgi:hypothetical protein
MTVGIGNKQVQHKGSAYYLWVVRCWTRGWYVGVSDHCALKARANRLANPWNVTVLPRRDGQRKAVG